MRLLSFSLILITTFAPIISAGQPFLLKNLNTSGDSNPVWLTDVNGVLFFSADDGIKGQELWKTDGTSAGTVLVKDISPGLAGSAPKKFLNINDTLFFEATDGNGLGLWKSSGTEDGTLMLKNLPGYYLIIDNLTDVNGILFFNAVEDGVYKLYKSDGTPEGTVEVYTNYSDFVDLLTNVNGTLFFTEAYNNLYKSDGTEEGTVEIDSLSYTDNLTDVNGTLFFSSADNQIWKSDGNEAGTVKIKDIKTTGNANVTHFINVDGTLFFSAENDANGQELWKSDGTETGTVLVKDINPGLAGSNPSNFINIDGILFFSADDGVNGNELWQSDGTETGTVMVKDINPGAAGSNPSWMINTDGDLYFTATNGINGYELFESDGTEEGTVLVSDIYLGEGSSMPKFLTKSGGNLFFSTNNYELWVLPLVDNNNDECLNAVEVFSGQTVYGSNASATGTDLTDCGYNDTADVWFSFKPQATGYYTIKTASEVFDTTLAVFNACGGNQLACNDDYRNTDSQVVLNMIKGKRYYIRIAGSDGQTGNFELNISPGYCTEFADGDLNRDCKVDFTDFTQLASEWMSDLSQ